VSLKSSEAALVLLQQTEEAYHPIALAITGQYDRLGSIDMIDEDENTELVLTYFGAQRAKGVFVVEEWYQEEREYFPFETIELLLRCFERTMNDPPEAALLDGRPVVFALVAATVWNAIVRAAPKPSGDDRATFDRLFKGVPVANEIYSERLEDVTLQLRELAAVSDFLAARTLPWTPATDLGQHYGDDMRQFLAEARATFQDSAVVLNGLKAYEHQVSDLLGDE
jgi:hypothetical protein